MVGITTINTKLIVMGILLSLGIIGTFLLLLLLKENGVAYAGVLSALVTSGMVAVNTVQLHEVKTEVGKVAAEVNGHTALLVAKTKQAAHAEGKIEGASMESDRNIERGKTARRRTDDQ